LHGRFAINVSFRAQRKRLLLEFIAEFRAQKVNELFIFTLRGFFVRPDSNEEWNQKRVSATYAFFSILAHIIHSAPGSSACRKAVPFSPIFSRVLVIYSVLNAPIHYFNDTFLHAEPPAAVLETVK
jgi:hypothetical protein